MADKDISIGIKTTADTSGADKATEAVKQTTEATKELTAAEADRAKRKEEYEARLAAKRADGSNTSAGSGEGANPMADGSQLDAGPEPEAVKESTAAIVEQVAALEDLTDAEAGVIDATKRLNDESRKPDGFKALFDQQRLQEIGKEVGKLGATVGDLAREFLKTEAGQRMFEGLSEETKTFGGIALQTGAAVAQGWAQGGPIGAALAGLNVLVKEVGDSFVATARAEEEAARSFADEQARITKQTEERRKEAASDAIEKQIARENDKLQDQSEILREQQGLLKSRKELADADFELKQAQDEAAGKSKDQLEIERIQKDLRDKENEVKGARGNRQDERNIIERERDALGIRAENARRQGDPEKAKKFEEDQAKADEALRDRERADAAKAQAEENELEAARRRAAAGLTRVASGASRDAANDTERRQRERDAAEERDRRVQGGVANRRAGLGREGEGIADQAAGSRGVNPRQAAALEKMGDDLAANPTADAADALGNALEKLAASLSGKDEAAARKFRSLAQKVDALEAKLKTKGDP